MLPLYAAFFLSVMIVTSIKILLPDIMLSLNVDLNWLTWVVNAYSLPLAVFIPIAGKIGDLFGPRRFFILGLLALAAGSLICGTAFTLTWLITGRVVQAVGAALVVPNAMAILLAGEADLRRGRVLGIWSSIGASGAVFGPVVSGLLVDILSWRGSFLIVAILAALITLSAWKHLPVTAAMGRAGRERKIPFDVAGASLLMAAVFILLLAITLLPDRGWESGWIPLSLVSFLLLLVSFIRVERRAVDPMLDISLLGQPRFSLGLAVGFLEQFVMAGTLFVLPIFFHTIHHHNAATTALLLTPAAVAAVLFSPAGGRASDHFGPGIPVTIGMILRALSFCMLSWIGAETSYLYLAAALAINGMGFGLTTVPALNAVIASVDGGHHGIASGMHNMIRFTGAAAGTTISGILLYALIPADPSVLTGAIPGYRDVFLMSAAVCLLGIAAGIWLWRKTTIDRQSTVTAAGINVNDNGKR